MKSWIKISRGVSGRSEAHHFSNQLGVTPSVDMTVWGQFVHCVLGRMISLKVTGNTDLFPGRALSSGLWQLSLKKTPSCREVVTEKGRTAEIPLWRGARRVNSVSKSGNCGDTVWSEMAQWCLRAGVWLLSFFIGKFLGENQRALSFHTELTVPHWHFLPRLSWSSWDPQPFESLAHLRFPLASIPTPISPGFLFHPL